MNRIRGDIREEQKACVDPHRPFCPGKSRSDFLQRGSGRNYRIDTCAHLLYLHCAHLLYFSWLLSRRGRHADDASCARRPKIPFELHGAIV